MYKTSLAKTLTSTRHIRTSLAEEALKRLAMRQADYHTVLFAQHGNPPWGRHQLSTDARHENALVDAVAATEVFTGQRLRHANPSLTEDDVFSWKKREKNWAMHAGVTLADAGEDWTELCGYIEIRNGIQHGLGRLTDFQLTPDRRAENLKLIRATRCQLDGDLLRVTSAVVDRCFSVCRTFIAWLDVQHA